ncbi:putative neutral amino acid permease [Aspergillus taichungensis]|uniref:Putative neutral amino acid permease n=1 Tax=Aspergillus taichungensis TaxID=482145 RepID=A0A2J5I0P6_9EURO|nr:putative neutral amino acid permease [Aspergillus taichungensis]
MAASEPKGEDQLSHTSERQPSSASDNGDPPLCKSKLDPESQIPQGAINSDSESGDVGRQIELEAGNSIKYRTCSWQKTAALLFSEYICLAMMSFPWSYSILGLVPGLILTVFVAGVVLYTSLIIWRFCLRHPQVRDVCDIGQYLFWDSKIAWYFTAVMFLLNNTFIQALHCLVGAEWFNTVTGHGACTIVFALVTAIISLVCSLPRTFSTLSQIATFSALFTFISVLLAMIFAGIEKAPARYTDKDGPPVYLAFPAPGTTFVQGLNAFLNISYTFIGQITLPSFIAEMKEPQDFWKSVTAVTIAEIILFSLVGSIVYVYTGNQYMTTPAFGSLGNEIYKKVSFSFMVPTLIFLGVLYASVSARFIFFRIFDGTRHKGNHTVVGWATWTGILALLWILAFIIAEVIPFFPDLLSIMSSLFDSFFGFIFWGVAYIRMRHADYGPDFYRKRGIRGWVGLFVNVSLIGIGFFFLGPGTYASVMAVILNYRAGTVGGPFSCADNGL